MKYLEVVEKSLEDINATLEKPTCEAEIINSILSLVYFHKPEVSAPILLNQIRSADFELRLSLIEKVEAYMRIHETVFLVEELKIEILSNVPERHRAEIEEVVEVMNEL